jgi:hypothetical protein
MLPRGSTNANPTILVWNGSPGVGTKYIPALASGFWVCLQMSDSPCTAQLALFEGDLAYLLSVQIVLECRREKISMPSHKPHLYQKQGRFRNTRDIPQKHLEMGFPKSLTFLSYCCELHKLSSYTQLVYFFSLFEIRIIQNGNTFWDCSRKYSLYPPHWERVA